MAIQQQSRRQIGKRDPRHYTTRTGRPTIVASIVRPRMMPTRVLRVAFLIALGGTFGLQGAHADIYTWVDASGSINVSNLAPPDGVRVTSIMHASAPAATSDETDRDAARQAKTQALEDRVRQLE